MGYTTIFNVVASATPNSSAQGVSVTSVLALSGANEDVNITSFKLALHDKGKLYKWVGVGY